MSSPIPIPTSAAATGSPGTPTPATHARGSPGRRAAGASSRSRAGGEPRQSSSSTPVSSTSATPTSVPPAATPRPHGAGNLGRAATRQTPSSPSSSYHLRPPRTPSYTPNGRPKHYAHSQGPASSPAASFNATSSRGSRRNADTGIHYEVSPQDLGRDTAMFISQDGRRASRTAINIGLKNHRVGPEDLEDAYGDWMPVREDGPLEGLGDDAWGQGEEQEGDAEGHKRKRYLSSTEPNRLWRPRLQTCVDEFLRLEGLGDDMHDAKCACCADSTSTRLFRCLDCGVYLQCEDCVKSRHQDNPLHVLREWNGRFWADTTFDSLRLVYQVGHGGFPCRFLDPKERTMVVMHVNGIHTIQYHNCKCNRADVDKTKPWMRNRWYPATTVEPATCATFEVLDLFRLLNVVGNINVHDFVGMLERLTDATRLKPVPDRYKAFGRMSRQYDFTTRTKRAGGGHILEGVEATKKGGNAMACWPCPLDGINLPPGWREVDPEFRFLYMLILAIDANFRLKNRMRENELPDPSFGSGWGNLVEHEPYKEHLRGYVAEKDVSTCIAFAALMQKDTRMTTGLRVSGVGGVVCARHEVVRPHGMGDLQKGERYSNMDYIVLSAIASLSLLCLTFSYDIVCQWRINLVDTRMPKMPEHLRIPPGVELKFGLPVWHASAHESDCQVQHSLTYVEGVGRTDGEGIERVWSGLNPVAWSTKEMGEGARHDALENKIDHHNWEKNINQGNTLARRLVVAVEERDIQIAAFDEVDEALRSETRRAWKELIDDWLKDKTKRNPYQVEGNRRSGPTEAMVRLDLKKDELSETGEARMVQRKGATACLVAGMQLEDLQERIRAEKKGRTLLAGDLDGRLQELRFSFTAKLRVFRTLQGVHMAPSIRAVEAEEEARDADEPPPLPEDVKLWMPSELGAVERDVCAQGLGEREAKLRVAQASNALDSLRTRLHAKRFLLLHRNSNIVGQRQSTRANTLISQVGERVDALSAKYRRAHSALKVLKGAVYCATHCPELKPADVRLDEEHDLDAKARHRLALIGSSGHRHRNAPTLPKKKSKKRKTMSWIWTAFGGPEEDEVGMHDSVRVEWSKALARKVRWVEEVQLLREEMRRVMRYLQWRAAWWEGKRQARGDALSLEVRAGVDAYAARQAALHRTIARRFKTEWDRSASEIVRSAAQEDVIIGGIDILARRATSPVDAFDGGDEDGGDE